MDATHTRRYVAAGCLVVALLASGCDVVIGPPHQDLDDPSNAAGYWGQVSR